MIDEITGLYKKISIRDMWIFLSVMLLCFASGGNSYIRNISVFGCVVFCGGIFYGRIKTKYTAIVVALMAFIFLNSMVFNSVDTSYKDLLMYVIRIAGCWLIVSYTSKEEFVKNYLILLSCLCVLSLFCFLLVCLSIPLPGTTIKDGLWGTFYHTISIASEYEMAHKRNCGVFKEPGVFQIYINIAILFLMHAKSISLKKKRMLFWLFAITMISTKSFMGYLIFLLVLVICYLENRSILPRFAAVPDRSSRTRLFVCIALLILIEEMVMGVGIHAVQDAHSWKSRHDDTILTFLMAKDNPVIGIGLAGDPTPIWDEYYDRYEKIRLYKAYQKARSNGLGNFLADAGIPFTVLYFICTIVCYCSLADIKRTDTKVLLILFFLAVLMEEPLMPTPFFLLSFFYCLREKRVKTEATDNYVLCEETIS